MTHPEGWIGTWFGFTSTMVEEWQKLLKNMRTGVESGNYTADTLVKDSAGLWLAALDAWGGLVPSGGGGELPVAFFRMDTNDPKKAAHIPLGKAPKDPTMTDLTLLGSKGTIQPNPIFTYKAETATLHIQLTNLSASKKAGVYVGIVHEKKGDEESALAIAVALVE